MNLVALAALQPGAPQQGGGSMLMVVGWMAIIFAIFYFMVILPQKRKDKERKQLIERVKTGDRILFSGGIIGIVVNVKEYTLTVKLADNVKIEILRGAVAKVLEKEVSATEAEMQ